MSIDSVHSIVIMPSGEYGEKSNQGVQAPVKSCKTCKYENSDMQCTHPEAETRGFRKKEMAECYKKSKPVKTKNFDYMKKKAGRPKSFSIDI